MGFFSSALHSPQKNKTQTTRWTILHNTFSYLYFHAKIKQTCHSIRALLNIWHFKIWTLMQRYFSYDSSLQEPHVPRKTCIILVWIFEKKQLYCDSLTNLKNHVLKTSILCYLKKTLTNQSTTGDVVPKPFKGQDGGR